MQNNARGGRWFAYRWDVSTAPAAAVGLAPALAATVAGVFQLPSHREPPETTVRERCERYKWTMSFPMRT